MTTMLHKRRAELGGSRSLHDAKRTVDVRPKVIVRLFNRRHDVGNPGKMKDRIGPKKDRSSAIRSQISA